MLNHWAMTAGLESPILRLSPLTQMKGHFEKPPLYCLKKNHLFLWEQEGPLIKSSQWWKQHLNPIYPLGKIFLIWNWMATHRITKLSTPWRQISYVFISAYPAGPIVTQRKHNKYLSGIKLLKTMNYTILNNIIFIAISLICKLEIHIRILGEVEERQSPNFSKASKAILLYPWWGPQMWGLIYGLITWSCDLWKT